MKTFTVTVDPALEPIMGRYFELVREDLAAAGKAMAASARPKVSPKSAITPARNTAKALPQPRKVQPSPVAKAAATGSDWEEF